MAKSFLVVRYWSLKLVLLNTSLFVNVCMSLVVKSDNHIRLISLLPFFSFFLLMVMSVQNSDFALSIPFLYFHSHNLSLNWILSPFRIQTFITNGKCTIKRVRINFTNTVSSIQPEPELFFYSIRQKKKE